MSNSPNGEWVYDDPEIPDDSVLFRRVPDRPNLCLVDAITGEISFLKGAFRYDKGGMSVSRKDLMEQHGVALEDAARDDQLIAAFKAYTPRQGEGGVIDTPGDEDPDMHKHLHFCHSSVRCQEEEPPKAMWEKVREELLKDAFLVRRKNPRK